MSITTWHVSVVQNQGDEGEDDAEELPHGAWPGELWLVESWSRDLDTHLWLVHDQVPDERVREMVLEEHLECGCACHQLGHRECLGRFNTTTCECGCSVQQFGQVEALNIFWTKYFSLTLHVSRGQVMPHPRPVTKYLLSPCLSPESKSMEWNSISYSEFALHSYSISIFEKEWKEWQQTANTRMRVSSSHRGNILRLENYKVFALEHWSNRGHLLSACRWFIEKYNASVI